MYYSAKRYPSIFNEKSKESFDQHYFFLATDTNKVFLYDIHLDSKESPCKIYSYHHVLNDLISEYSLNMFHKMILLDHFGPKSDTSNIGSGQKVEFNYRKIKNGFHISDNTKRITDPQTSSKGFIENGKAEINYYDDYPYQEIRDTVQWLAEYSNKKEQKLIQKLILEYCNSN